eukprot:1889385-Rhodomonas_salina.1
MPGTTLGVSAVQYPLSLLSFLSRYAESGTALGVAPTVSAMRLGEKPTETDYYEYYEKGVYEPRRPGTTTPLLPYARPTRSPVLTSGVVLPGNWTHVPVRLKQSAMAYKASNAQAQLTGT